MFVSLALGILLLAASWWLAAPAQPGLRAAWLFVLSLPAGAVPMLLVMEFFGAGAGAQAAGLRRLLILLPAALLLAIPALLGTFHEPGSFWHDPLFVAVRSALYLLVWILLGRLLARPRSGAPRLALCRLGFLAYAVTATLAATDWIGGGQPGPDAASLGLLLITSQLVLAAAAARLLGAPPSPAMAVCGVAWGFVAFTRFLTTWSADMPGEIVYYLHRDGALGQGVGWLGCAVVAASLLALLPGPFQKISAFVAALVLVAHGADFLCMVTPLRGRFTIAVPDVFAIAGGAALAAGVITLRPASRQAP